MVGNSVPCPDFGNLEVGPWLVEILILGFFIVRNILRESAGKILLS